MNGAQFLYAAALAACALAPLRLAAQSVAADATAEPSLEQPAAARSLALRPVPLPAFAPGAAAARAERGRYTKRGAIIGGAIGAVAGLGAGVFISLLCSVDSDNDCDGAIPIVTLLGAGAGALGGAIIGAAIPRDSGTEPDSAGREPRGAARRFGSASLAASAVGARGGMVLLAGSEDEWRAGAGLRFNFFAELGDWFAIGPQLGVAWLEGDGGVRHAALAVRASHAGRRIAPYVAADLGAYQRRQTVAVPEGPEYTGTLEFLGGSLGAGARFFPFGSPRLFLDLDARWHRHMQNTEPFDMTALSIGLGRVW